MSLLEIDEIHTYYGKSHVLQGVSLDVDRGEIVALMGRNGAGKTTTMRSIMGIAPPKRGTITFDGETISGKDPHEIARTGIGFVPEERRIFPDLTVRENLEAVATSDSEYDTARIFDEFPLLERRKNNLGKQLSGGEQQMLAVARAMIIGPELLLLDEPSEGLAPVIVDDLEAVLARICDTGMTVLLAEQNMKFVFSLAERGYIISKGQIVWDGTVEDVQEDQDLLDAHIGITPDG